jgi:hypothetical protein
MLETLNSILYMSQAIAEIRHLRKSIHNNSKQGSHLHILILKKVKGTLEVKNS